MNPLQFGFRPGSGAEDVQHITRSILEETAQSAHTMVFLIRFFDLKEGCPVSPILSNVYHHYVMEVYGGDT